MFVLYTFVPEVKRICEWKTHSDKFVVISGLELKGFFSLLMFSRQSQTSFTLSIQPDPQVNDSSQYNILWKQKNYPQNNVFSLIRIQKKCVKGYGLTRQ